MADPTRHTFYFSRTSKHADSHKCTRTSQQDRIVVISTRESVRLGASNIMLLIDIGPRVRTGRRGLAADNKHSPSASPCTVPRTAHVEVGRQLCPRHKGRNVIDCERVIEFVTQKIPVGLHTDNNDSATRLFPACTLPHSSNGECTYHGGWSHGDDFINEDLLTFGVLIQLTLSSLNVS